MSCLAERIFCTKGRVTSTKKWKSLPGSIFSYNSSFSTFHHFCRGNTFCRARIFWFFPLSLLISNCILIEKVKSKKKWAGSMNTSLRGSRLSLQQARQWTFARENQAAYQVQGVVLLEGSLVINHLKQALQKLIERHEILRTVFRALPGMDMPMQVVGEPRLGWHLVNLESVDEQEQQSMIPQLLSSLLPVAAVQRDIQEGPTLICH